MKKLYLATAVVLMITAGVCSAGVYREHKQIEQNKTEYAKISKEKQMSSTSVDKKTSISSHSIEKVSSTTQESSHTTESTRQFKTEDYTIQSGDTLSMIAQTCHISVDRLVELNHWKKPKTLIAGNTIQIPEGKSGVLKEKHKKKAKAKESSSTKASTAIDSTTAQISMNNETQSSLTTQETAPISAEAPVVQSSAQVSQAPIPANSVAPVVQNTINNVPIQ